MGGSKNSKIDDESISAETPLEIMGIKWRLITKLAKSEALKTSSTLQWAILGLIGLSCLLILIGSFWVSNSLARQIHKIGLKLLKGAEDVAQSSEKLSLSSSDLSSAATEQAASLQQTVSSIDEISSMVQRNSDAANSSTLVSTKSNEAAVKGKKTVEEMIESINEVASANTDIMNEMQKNNAEFSRIVSVISEIGEKTKVINDIVFQTKLLSFNASVEAARAGEHGKGFAVVAEEVGNLAAMSGKAALEITEMLDGSIKQVQEIVDQTKGKVERLVTKGKEKVEAGTKTAHVCGDVLDEILQNVSTVNDMVREIASASSEQSTGVQEVTKAMQQLDETTHRNTSAANESSQMSQHLNSQAEDLNRFVAELLTLVNGGGPDAPGAAPVLKTRPDHSQTMRPTGQLLEMTSKNHLVEKQVSTPTKKVSGLDTGIPSEDDPRFEDL